MNVLVLNCGSASVKLQFIGTDLDRIASDTDERLARGQVERVGGEAIITFEVRARICDGLGWVGLELDTALNEQTKGRREGRISRDGSRLAAYVIPTDEELLIARDTVRSVRGVRQRY